ncbi:MAG: hypothetical protein HYR60_14615 [Acidobacteria bacterium]|nr:hypothetical protein [Acidobacteriota bacterium]
MATRSADPVERRQAFEILVSAYWKPVYKHLRMKWNQTDEDAQDLTQAFFGRTMENAFFQGYDPAKSSFRTYLRLCLDGFASNERKAARRLKRGGGAQILSLDFESAEGELRQIEIADGVSVEERFHQEWVRSVFALAVERLRAFCDERGKTSHYRLFARYDLEEERVTYAQLAQEFTLPATDVTNYLAWARREFRRIVLEVLRELTATEREFREEARYVLGVQK